MRKLSALLAFLSVAVFAIYLGIAHAAIPWGVVNAIPSTGASPICTSFAAAPVCIMSINTTLASITILGTPTTTPTGGTDVVLVWMQNGTGGFNWAAAVPTSIVVNLAGSPVPSSIPSTAPTGANQFQVWVMQPTVNTAATPVYLLLATYDNPPLFDTFTTTQSFGSAAIASGVASQAPTVLAPGMTVSHACICQPQTFVGANTQGVSTSCTPGTNVVQCSILNSTATSVTPTTLVYNIRLIN